MYPEAKACSSVSIARLKNLKRRTIDVIASRLYFYYSLSYEQTGDLSETRGNLLALHHSATLRHDELGQETLLNLLLRNYLHYNLYDQAEKLRSKALRFEAHSNQQFCRYLFYLGKIRTIQLEYTMQKKVFFKQPGKAPIAALGFRIQCNKWAILVRLLLGEIPERSIFMQKRMEKVLRPYFELTNMSGEDWRLGAVQDSPREVLRDTCSRPNAQSHYKTTPQCHQDRTSQHKHLILENLPS